MKKAVMGIIGFMPAVLCAAGVLLTKLAAVMLRKADYETFMPGIWGSVDRIGYILITAAFLTYFAAVIVYFIYNIKNQYIYPDKKIGWGYMIVCIGIVAMPAYWYNFIRKI